MELDVSEYWQETLPSHTHTDTYVLLRQQHGENRVFREVVSMRTWEVDLKGGDRGGKKKGEAITKSPQKR